MDKVGEETMEDYHLKRCETNHLGTGHASTCSLDQKGYKPLHIRHRSGENPIHSKAEWQNQSNGNCKSKRSLQLRCILQMKNANRMNMNMSNMDQVKMSHRGPKVETGPGTKKSPSLSPFNHL